MVANFAGEIPQIGHATPTEKCNSAIGCKNVLGMFKSNVCDSHVNASQGTFISLWNWHPTFPPIPAAGRRYWRIKDMNSAQLTAQGMNRDEWLLQRKSERWNIGTRRAFDPHTQRKSSTPVFGNGNQQVDNQCLRDVRNGS
jgi:hypothetical protein